MELFANLLGGREGTIFSFLKMKLGYTYTKKKTQVIIPISVSNPGLG